MAEFHDSLYYPFTDAQGNPALLSVIAADKWVTPPGYGRHQIGAAMGFSRGIGSIDGAAAPALSIVNSAHVALSPDQYSMCAFAVPMDSESQTVVCRYDAARDAYYELSQAFLGGSVPWLGYDSQGRVVCLISRIVNGQKTVLGGFSLLHNNDMFLEDRKRFPSAACVGDMDYYKLEVWGGAGGPVRLRGSIIQGGGGGVRNVGQPLGNVSNRWYYGTAGDPARYPEYPLHAFCPPEGPIAPYGPTPAQCVEYGVINPAPIIYQSYVFEDASPERILAGQPGVFGGDPVTTVGEGYPGGTNLSAGFYAGDLDPLTVGVVSQSGSSARIGGTRKPASTVVVTLAGNSVPAAPTLNALPVSTTAMAIPLSGDCDPSTQRLSVYANGQLIEDNIRPDGATWNYWFIPWSAEEWSTYSITVVASNVLGDSAPSTPRVIGVDLSAQTPANTPTVDPPAGPVTNPFTVTGTATPGDLVVVRRINGTARSEAYAYANAAGVWTAQVSPAPGTVALTAQAYHEGFYGSAMPAYRLFTVS